jgi:hypothetical protein
VFNEELFFHSIRVYQNHFVLNGTQVVQNSDNDLCTLKGNSVKIVRDVHKVGMRFQYQIPIKSASFKADSAKY